MHSPSRKKLFNGLVVGALTLSCSTPQADVSSLSYTTSAPQRLQLQGNVFTSSSQGDSSLAMASDGRTALVWNSKRQEGGTFGVYARIFDDQGQPLSAEIHVNEFLPQAQWQAAAAFAADASLWIAWESFGQDGSGAGLVARRFDANGNPFGGELAINQQRDGEQTQVVLAAGPQQQMLAVWASRFDTDAGNTTAGLRARLLSPDGAEHQEILLSDAIGDRRPAVCSLADGKFFLTWTRDVIEENRSTVMAMFLDALGQPQGAAFELVDDASRDHVEPVVTTTAHGDLAVAWMRSCVGGYEVVAQGFDATAIARGDVQVLATPQDGWKSGVAICADQDGGFAIAYNQDRWLPSSGEVEQLEERLVLAKRFDADFVCLDDEAVRLSDHGLLARTSAATRLAYAADGRLVASFDGDSGNGDGSAANLAMLLPGGMQLANTQSHSKLDVAAPAISDADMLAANPPIWDPNWVPQQRLMTTMAASGDFGFEGVPGTGWTPPDPEIAVGPTDIIVMTNGNISNLSKTGNLIWSDEIENSFGFWGSLNTGSFVFDPECTWDPHSQRFLAMACERTNGRSYFLFAISKDSSPGNANDWHKYRFDVTSISGNDIDSPNMAVGPDSILLTADFFSPDKYLIYILDKSSVLNGGSAVTTHELITGTSQQSMGVPVVYDNDPNLYIIQSTEYSSNSTIILHAISNPFTAYNRTTTSLSVPTYSYPAHPPQKGSSSRPYLFEPRFWSCAQRNGSLWAVHHVNNSRARVRWYEIDMNNWPISGSPSLAQDGEIDLGSGIYTYFPSIHIDADSNVAITYARSASNEYISMGRSIRAATDPPGTMRPGQVVQTSTNAHTSGRWGDYSGTQVDPGIVGTFWGHHEYNIGGTSSWRTWVAKYVMRDDPFLLAPFTLTAGSVNNVPVTGATPNGRVYFAYSTVGTALSETPALSTTLSIESPTLAGSRLADAAGNASLAQFIPPGFAGQTVWVQAAEAGHATNWVQVTIQ
ncbi:MAG: hypothetical protein QF489_00430 [Planctomycetota bacterium]|nr:hypothetical protein [Planctomycetota bacterium]